MIMTEKKIVQVIIIFFYFNIFLSPSIHFVAHYNLPGKSGEVVVWWTSIFIAIFNLF